MKIKIIKSVVTGRKHYKAGEVIDLPKPVATTLIDQGFATENVEEAKKPEEGNQPPQ